MADEKDQKKEEIKEEQKPAETPKAEEKVEDVKSETPKIEEVKPEVKLKEKKAETVEVKEEKPDKVEKKPAPSGKYKEIIEQIEKLSVLELSELVKELEDRFGVSAATPVAAAPAAGETPKEEEASEKATATLHLADAGAQKIAVIKALREINPDLGLKEAKDLADGAPKDVKADMPKEEAEEAKKKLEEAGAKVELK